MSRTIHHLVHGHDEHDLAIFLAERMIIESGNDILDGQWFAKKHNYAGVPDIHCRVYQKRHDGVKAVHDFQDHVIEMESHLTKANREKKYNQFQASNSGVELIIINLADLKGDHDSISELEAFIRKRLLFVEG